MLPTGNRYYIKVYIMVLLLHAKTPKKQSVEPLNEESINYPIVKRQADKAIVPAERIIHPNQRNEEVL